MSGPFRPLLPKSDEDSPPAKSTAQPSRKRKAVTLACQRCRTRKGKCDAARPACWACSSKGVPCEYDDDPNTTPHANLKREYHRLEQQQQNLLELYGMLKDRPEQEANVILQRLRSGADVHSLLAFIKEGDLVTQLQASNVAASLPGDTHTTEHALNVNHPQAYPPLAPLDDPEAGLGLKEKNILNTTPREDYFVTEEDLENARSLAKPHRMYDDRLRNIDAKHWTTVTDSNIVMANLISLYLSWDHVTLRTLDEEYFLDQLSTGGNEYCSALLVNAMMAAASLNYAAIDPPLSRKLGPAFFDEAKRLWHEAEGEAHILQVPAAIFLSMWCKSNGINELADVFITQGIRIAQDLGLFEKDVHNEQRLDLSTRKYWKGRAIIAWGLFNWQTIHAFYLHKATQLPNPPFFVIPYDFLTQQQDQGTWNSFPLIRPDQTLHRDIGFKAHSELFSLLYDYLRIRDMSAAATDKITEYHNADMFYSKMLTWADKLPPEMVRGPDSLPMVIDLHMFYHGIVVEVFRHWVGAESPHKGKAREIMQASLAQLRRLLFVQRYRYDGPPFNSTTIGSIHILTYALLEDLAKSDSVDPETSFYLVMCAESMKKYGEAFPEIHIILHNLLAKARERSTHLPQEVAVIFDELDARLFNRTWITASANRYPLEIQIAITDPSGMEMEDLIRATYSIDINPAMEERDDLQN